MKATQATVFIFISLICTSAICSPIRIVFSMHNLITRQSTAGIKSINDWLWNQPYVTQYNKPKAQSGTSLLEKQSEAFIASVANKNVVPNALNCTLQKIDIHSPALPQQLELYEEEQVIFHEINSQPITIKRFIAIDKCKDKSNLLVHAYGDNTKDFSILISQSTTPTNICTIQLFDTHIEQHSLAKAVPIASYSFYEIIGDDGVITDNMAYGRFYALAKVNNILSYMPASGNAAGVITSMYLTACMFPRLFLWRSRNSASKH